MVCLVLHINYVGVREAAKKPYFLNGSAIKRGGGKALAIKKKKLFLRRFFLFVELPTAIKLEGGGVRL